MSTCRVVANIQLLSNPRSSPPLSKKIERFPLTVRKLESRQLLTVQLPRRGFDQSFFQKPVFAKYFKGTQSNKSNKAYAPENVRPLIPQKDKGDPRSEPRYHVESNNKKSDLIKRTASCAQQIHDDYDPQKRIGEPIRKRRGNDTSFTRQIGTHPRHHQKKQAGKNGVVAKINNTPNMPAN